MKLKLISIFTKTCHTGDVLRTYDAFLRSLGEATAALLSEACVHTPMRNSGARLYQHTPLARDTIFQYIL